MTQTVELWVETMTDQETFLRELGERIARLRKEQGLTQTQLGNLVKVTQQVIAEYEAGYRNIPIYRLISLAEALGVSTEELLKPVSAEPKKRGPAPKFQRLVDQVGRLPKSRQQFVVEMLENALQAR